MTLCVTCVHVSADYRGAVGGSGAHAPGRPRRGGSLGATPGRALGNVVRSTATPSRPPPGMELHAGLLDKKTRSLFAGWQARFCVLVGVRGAPSVTLRYFDSERAYEKAPERARGEIYMRVQPGEVLAKKIGGSVPTMRLQLPGRKWEFRSKEERHIDEWVAAFKSLADSRAEHVEQAAARAARDSVPQQPPPPPPAVGERARKRVMVAVAKCWRVLKIVDTRSMQAAAAAAAPGGGKTADWSDTGSTQARRTQRCCRRAIPRLRGSAQRSHPQPALIWSEIVAIPRPSRGLHLHRRRRRADPFPPRLLAARLPIPTGFM